MSETEIMTDKERIAALEARVLRMKKYENELASFTNQLEHRLEMVEAALMLESK